MDWPTSVEVSSLDLIPSYVRAGFGIGLSVVAPGEKPPVKIRLLPWPSFPPLIIAAIWQGKMPPIGKHAWRQSSHTRARLRGMLDSLGKASEACLCWTALSSFQSRGETKFVSCTIKSERPESTMVYLVLSSL